MKIKVLIAITLVVFSFCTPSYTLAADGDLVVNGNISVGFGIKFSDNSTQSSAAPGNALIWDYTVTGSPITSAPAPALNCNADGGYEFEFLVERGANGSVMVAFNDDTTATNYFGQFLEVYGATVDGANTNQNTIMGFASATDFIHGRGSILCPPSGIVTLIGTFSMYQNGTNMVRVSQIRKTSSISNLTSLAVNGSVANTIGVNSRFRLWKKR